MSITSLVGLQRSTTGPMGQTALRPRGLKNDFGFAYKRAVQIMVTVMVIFFAPLSFTYFFDETHASNLSDKALAILVSPEFAYGEGSATLSDTNGGQMRIYLRNFTAMFSHTIAGSIAIVIGLAQFNTTLQFKYPAIHRFLGRLYTLCALIISWSSSSFLADAMPGKEVFSGDPFAFTLLSLSLGLLGTLASALYAIWNSDMDSHREFMVLNYAFMLSAPVLRVEWMILGRVWGETKYIINLYSSIFSGPFLIMVSIFYLRQQHRRPSNSVLLSSKFRVTVTVCGLLGLLFQIIQGPPFHGGPYPRAFFLALGLPLSCYATLFVILARAAKRRGDIRSYTAWITYQNGLISAPLWSVLVLYISREVLGFSEESLWMITVTGGVALGLFISFLVYVFATSNMANSSQHTVKSH